MLNLSAAPPAAPAQFPAIRPRRRRRTAALRSLVRENRLAAEQFIQPFFLCHGSNVRKPIGSMPGVSQISVDGILDQELDRVARAGLRSVILFGIPAAKDAVGSENFDPEGIVQQGIRRIKARHSDLCVITDLCCCEYTSHGHCGVLHGEEVDNDATLEILGRAAQTYAAAGERGLGQLGHGTFPGSAAGKRRTPPT